MQFTVSHTPVNVAFTVIFFLIQSATCATDPPNGSITMSTIAFDKIVKAHKYVLAKFDEGYPYGDKQDTYAKVCGETATAEDFLCAEVRVQDYGDRANADLAERFSLSKSEYPAYLIFKNGNVNEPLRYRGNVTNAAELNQWVVETTGLYFPMDGCIEALDKLALRFMDQEKDRPTLFEEMKAYAKTVKEDAGDKLEHAKFYVKVAEKVLGQGMEFVQKEKDRLKKLLKGSLSAKKKESITRNLNILTMFRPKLLYSKTEL